MHLKKRLLNRLKARWIIVSAISLLAGCQSLQTPPVIPDFYRYDREGIIFHTDIAIQSDLITKITEFKKELSHFFAIENAPEIEIFLFSNRSHLDQYIRESRPHYPNRRAFYVRNKNTHKIYAYLDDKIEVDLRHELTHVFVQSIPRQIPLWLDEGLAEYFEVINHDDRLNQTHLEYLILQQKTAGWLPNHNRLKQCEDPLSFSQANYAESWLWVHWMMHQFDHDVTFIELTQRYSEGVLTELAGLPVQMQLQDNQQSVEQHLKSLDD